MQQFTATRKHRRLPVRISVAGLLNRPDMPQNSELPLSWKLDIEQHLCKFRFQTRGDLDLSLDHPRAATLETVWLVVVSARVAIAKLTKIEA